MVDVIPILLLVFGLVSAIKPEWIAAIHRHQKAAGTDRRPEDIGATETWMGMTRVAGIIFILFGLVFRSRVSDRRQRSVPFFDISNIPFPHILNGHILIIRHPVQHGLEKQ